MRFLHIADVHFGCEKKQGFSQADISTRNNYMDKLTKTICEINKKNKFDFILFTGDIAWSASSEEYNNAANWLTELLDKCGLTSKNLFLCPGNHDIDRDEIEDIQYPTNQNEANCFLQIEKTHKLQRRFSKYLELCANLGLEPYKIGDRNSFLIGYRDFVDYRIICLNTAWFAKNDDVKDKMWVGSGFCEIIKEAIKDIKKPTITIMHHPSYCWHEQERSNYSETTNVYKEVCGFSDLILTGHCHEVITSMAIENDTLVGGTGALFENSNYENCFYSYEIDFTKIKGQNRVRHFWNAKKWYEDKEIFSLLTSYSFKKKKTEESQIRNVSNVFSAESNINQSNLYYIAGQVIQYVPIVGSWSKGENEYYYGDFNVDAHNKKYDLPDEILSCFYNTIEKQVIKSIEDNVDEEKVRFDGFEVQIHGGDRPHSFNLKLSRVTYRDFLIVKSIIDYKLLSGETIRNKYLSEKNALVSGKLPNICGVGIFIITVDKKIIISESSPYVKVNPERYIYSASGSMNWNGIETNPFDDIIRECEEEIGYTPNIENLRLYSIGMDYATGYYQFSFYEYSSKTAAEIIGRAHMARDFNIEIQRIFSIGFNCEEIMRVIHKDNWDETAKANLLTLAAKYFGIEVVQRSIAPSLEKKDYRRKIMQMWDMRADRNGRLPVLSGRYPAQGLEQSSNEYVNAVLDFIDEDLSNNSILELGGGIGLFTKHLAKSAKEVTCVDVCEKMIQKNKKYLGNKLSQKVDYVNCFFQDYETSKHFDILICSLVLIHNAPELDDIIKNMKRLSNIIYLFEHTDQGTQVSMHTDLKSADEYIAMFPEYDVIKRSSHMLCQDKISFIKLSRTI